MIKAFHLSRYFLCQSRQYLEGCQSPLADQIRFLTYKPYHFTAFTTRVQLLGLLVRRQEPQAQPLAEQFYSNSSKNHQTDPFPRVFFTSDLTYAIFYFGNGMPQIQRFSLAI